MTGKEIVKLNESALASVLADVSFIEIEIKRLGKPELDHVFDEVKHVCNLPPFSQLNYDRLIHGF